MSSGLVISQQLLEQNEDIIAAIVENLQMGRLNDCMQHYSILQANLVSLANELDNFPADECDPYSKLDIFPDEIMRKDILEDLRPPGSARAVPDPPIVPSCIDCMARGISAATCRIELRHVEPSGKFTAPEREEFFRVAQVLAMRHQQYNDEVRSGKHKNPTYKKWAPSEVYSLCVAWWFYGTDVEKFVEILEHRGEGQIRSKITHLQREGEWPPKMSAIDLLDNREKVCPGYQPPPLLAHFFAAHAAGIDPFSVRGKKDFSTAVPVGAGGLDGAAGGNRGQSFGEGGAGSATGSSSGGGGGGGAVTSATSTMESALAPSPDRPDFNLLLAIAAGVSTHALEDLPTRVPSSPPPGHIHVGTLLDSQDAAGSGISIITDVGGQHHAVPGIAKLESTYPSMVEDGAPLRQPLPFGASGMAAAAAAAQQVSALKPAGGQVGGAPRHVHWGANTESLVPRVTDLTDDVGVDRSVSPSNNSSSNHSHSTAGGNGSGNNSAGGKSQFMLPSLSDPNVTSYLPPPPLGAPAFLRDPLKEILNGNTQDAKGESHRQLQSQSHLQDSAQARTKEEDAIKALKEREESAFKGLEGYNLEYARTLQAANIPFRMITNTGTLVVVQPSGATTISELPPTRARGAAPPFAQPGINRLRQQQADQRKRKLQSSPVPGTAASANGTSTGTTPTSAAASSTSPAGGNVEAPGQREGQVAKLQRGDIGDALTSSSRQLQAPHEQERDHGSGTSSNDSPRSQPAGMLGAAVAGPASKAPRSPARSSSAGSSSSGGGGKSEHMVGNSSEGSLFSRILAGGGGGKHNTAAAQQKDRTIPPLGGVKRKGSNSSTTFVQDQDPAEPMLEPPAALLQAVSRITHASAAVDVSMSGYEEDEDANTSHSRRSSRHAAPRPPNTAASGTSSRNMGTREGSNLRVPGDELSQLPDFSSEFSFL